MTLLLAQVRTSWNRRPFSDTISEVSSHPVARATLGPAEHSNAIVGEANDRPADLAALYRQWHHELERWLRAMGVREAELEDLGHEVFVTAHNRWGSFDGSNPAGWLYRIALLKVKNHRRHSWIRHLFSAKGGQPTLDLVDDGPGPAVAIELREQRRILNELLNKMPEKHRVTFSLFEIEGYDVSEIARMQQAPERTVRSRLLRARRVFFANVAAQQLKEGSVK